MCSLFVLSDLFLDLTEIWTKLKKVISLPTLLDENEKKIKNKCYGTLLFEIGIYRISSYLRLFSVQSKGELFEEKSLVFFINEHRKYRNQFTARLWYRLLGISLIVFFLKFTEWKNGKLVQFSIRKIKWKTGDGIMILFCNKIQMVNEIRYNKWRTCRSSSVLICFCFKLVYS